MLFASTFCMVGDVVISENNRKEVYAQREASHNVAGYLDHDMIISIIEKTSLADAVVTDDGNYPDDIYNEYILPYQDFRRNMIAVFSPLEADDDVFNELSSGDDIDFYATRIDGIKAQMKQAKLSQIEIDQTLNKNSSVVTPFYFDFHGG